MFYTTDLYQEAGVTDRYQRYYLYNLNPSDRRDVRPEDHHQQNKETQDHPEEEGLLGQPFEDIEDRRPYRPDRGGDAE